MRWLTLRERELILYFQQISKAAALYAKTLYHAEGDLTVALKTMSFPQEAWQCAKLLRAIPSCRLVIMAAYHFGSLSTEEASLMKYLQSPPDAGPTIGQLSLFRTGNAQLRRRLVEIGGWLPTANALHTSFTKNLSKHLAANKKVSFAFQPKSSLVPIMNPSPAEIADLLTFVEVTLIQYSTVAGHLPRVTAANTKVKRKKVNKVEVIQEEPPKKEPQANARPKSLGVAYHRLHLRNPQRHQTETVRTSWQE